MALNIEGQKCPVCNAYLFAEDDVVFCPICGAPHHRDCYKAIGHCALEHTHGTDEQYDRAKKAENEPPKPEFESAQSEQAAAAICPNCKNKLTDDMLVCPYCGRPRNARVFTFDLLGGINPDTDLGNGVTAKEARDFVLTNTQRYIPKFEQAKRRKASWNWGAFLFPEGWFLFRKMYKQGALATAIAIASQICFIPLRLSLNTAVFSSYNEYLNYFMENIHTFGVAPMLLAFLGASIMLALRILSGIFGDYVYKNHAIEKISEAKKQEEPELEIKKRGGVNVWAFLIGVAALNYLPSLLTMLF